VHWLARRSIIGGFWASQFVSARRAILQRFVTILFLIGGTALVVPFGRHSAAETVPASPDDARLGAAGVRQLNGRHLVLYTDLPSGPQVDALPALFDAAVPLWAAYFGLDPAATADWQVRAYLIRDRDKFAALQLLPADRELVNGYANATEIWVLDQTTDYYRRHLLLHEGTHAFMAAFLNGCGPGWYSEGMAELLATHRIGAAGREQGAGGKADPQLTLNIMPRSREEVPMLGRIKLVRDAVAAGDALTVDAIMQIDGRRQQEPQAYAWCWALAKFLDSHPRYRERFHELPQHVTDPEFNERVRSKFGSDWPELATEWQTYVAALDHGYDFERMAIEFERGTPLERKRAASIRADRGWQSSGIWLESGKTYRIHAHGRFQIAAERGTAWPCEPGGVTIEYHGGHPLGMLLGAIVPDQAAVETGFAQPLAIGLGAKIPPQVSGTLYLRVNDSAAKLGDNRGALTIEVGH
jgi:hypothetical protein